MKFDLKEYKLSDLKSIPNVLSIFRIILIPIFVNLYLKATTPEDYQLVALLVFISGLTDLLDGWIARRFNQITEIGKVIDPIADKLTQLAIIICLVTRYELMKPLLILFLVKEFTMAILGLYFYRKKEMKLSGAQWFGKLSTFVFYACSIIIFFMYDMELQLVNLLIIITGIFLSISLILYLKTYYEMYLEWKTSN